MTTYGINFANETPDTWTLCIYQFLPGSVGLESVAWKQTRVPRNGESGIEWNMEYVACLAEYKQSGGKGFYKALQRMRTELGRHWNCVYEDDVQQLWEAGATTSGQLLISNRSPQLANLGIGMDGSLALVKRSVYSGNNAQFAGKPKFYVALFHELLQGEIISGNQVYGPLEVVFSGDRNYKNFVARIEGSRFIFEEAGTKNRVEAPYEPR